MHERQYPPEWTLQQSIRLNGGEERETRRVLDYLPRRLWLPEFEKAARATGSIKVTGSTPPRWHDDTWLRVRMTELLRQRGWRLHVTLAPDSRGTGRRGQPGAPVCGAVLLRHGLLGRAFCLHMWAPFGQVEPHAAIQQLRQQAPKAANLVELMRMAGARLPSDAQDTDANAAPPREAGKRADDDEAAA